MHILTKAWHNSLQVFLPIVTLYVKHRLDSHKANVPVTICSLRINHLVHSLTIMSYGGHVCYLIFRFNFIFNLADFHVSCLHCNNASNQLRQSILNNKSCDGNYKISEGDDIYFLSFHKLNILHWFLVMFSFCMPCGVLLYIV